MMQIIGHPSLNSPLQGAFILPKRGIVILNHYTTLGAQSILRQQYRGESVWAGDLYIGLCQEVIDADMELGDITTEPSSAGGYARKALQLNTTDWPTSDLVNGIPHIRSKVLNFAASSANYSVPFTRLFLCDAASGSSGLLISMSAALNTPLLIEDGSDEDVQYEVYMKT